MGKYVHGFDDGTNNGIVTTIRSSYGWAHVDVKIPPRLVVRRPFVPPYDTGFFRKNTSFPIYGAELREGFAAHLDELRLADPAPGYTFVPCIERFQLLLKVTGPGIDVTKNIYTLHHHFDFQLPTGWDGEIRFQYTQTIPNFSSSYIYQANRDYPDDGAYTSGVSTSYVDTIWTNNFFWTWSFADFTYAVPSVDRVLEVMGFNDAPRLSQIAVPPEATSVRLSAYGAAGSIGKFCEKVAVEVPVSQMLPRMLLTCDFPDTVADESHAICRYIDRANTTYGGGTLKDKVRADSMCTIRRISCDGMKEPTECREYKPWRKCAFLAAKEFFDYDATTGVLTINDEDIQKFFNLNDGLAYRPYYAWKGPRPDWDKLHSEAFHACKTAPMYYCHRFENAEVHPHAQPCFARHTSSLPWALVGQNNIWRYVRPNNTIDLSCAERNWGEVVLKAHDIAATNPCNLWPDEKTVLGASLVHEGQPNLAPGFYLPQDLPDGAYEVWAYAKNTSALPLIIEADYPRRIRGQHREGATWTIPANTEYGWVRCQAIVGVNTACALDHQLGGGARVRISLKNGAGGFIITGSIYESGGEFALRSLYFERI
ncbi:MAG: hypothetical protein P1V51_20065 [Deltaproteobacteria bacterium]|nr:hypothetical protein [Deltaproteobacteria bacterium]